MNQVELELEAYGHGRERIRESIKRNEEAGRADSNPYAQKFFKEFVFPMIDVLKADLSVAKPGRQQAHTILLKGMDLEAVAYLAVRSGISGAMGDVGLKNTALSIGKAVYHEHLLTQFAEVNPTLFYYLMNDIEKRMSADERYKMNVMRNQAKKNDIDFHEWSNGNVLQVGYYLIDKLVQVGMLVTQKYHAAKNDIETTVGLSERAQQYATQISEFVIEMAPYWTPCVEPPKDWTSLSEGGYHTAEMRSMDPYMVHTHGSARKHFEHADLTKEYACINALQRTKWRVNARMVDIITNVSYHHDMKEIMMQADMPKPRKPGFLQGDLKEADMTEEQVKEFKRWKREMAGWHTDEKLRKLKGYRFGQSMQIARKFMHEPAIYFVYFRDFRGRYYVKTNGISPQGSDLQKALIEFGDGKPLLTKGAQDWFMITGANRFGVDKVTYEDRIKWVQENEHLILDWAAHPVDSTDWMKADKPLQFLAWCLEYADWKKYGDKFKSRVAAGMDGSCNGLQNFSAMLRDPVGGRAVNLLPSPLPNDIYQMVADRATQLLQAAEEDEHGYRSAWLKHVLTRSLVKRSVMTLPYGSKRTSCKDFIITDYLKQGKFPELDPKHYEPAAAYLSFKVWEAIGDVVVKAREAMDWLQQAARTIIKAGDETIRWTTPTGFPVVQVYFCQEVHRINTKLAGNMKIRINKETDETNINRHKNGIAPNFVHSLDASHLTASTLACVDRGITDFHMVHDDYGVHCAHAEELYEVIRSTFVDMYTRHDMLQELRDRYVVLDDVPVQGDLDLTQVLDSKYFFG
ncbi:DNA-directed RNA polymerase [Stenotrophomonas phage BUCT609]|uniref:DNA-directed RNA polymerase n=1 Tax=Stenotrophomonas phage BUCT609 TaxID=2834250 RepID=A0A8E6UR89_9CAUD|nr:DNA-directed RNA polymerase [Stenotrophomonas phage BUCT609]